MEKCSALYLVATPIGNLEDITLRALRILKEVDLIAAEDTRTSIKLLNHYSIKNKITSYHKFNEEKKKGELIEFIKSGKSIALISDSGTPGISDPGEILVKECIKNNIKVIPVPGPSALISAVSASGLSTRKIKFIGFLPLKNKERKKILNELKTDDSTVVFFETPHKIIKTLNELKEILGKRNIVASKEITKKFEEFFSGDINDVIGRINDKEKIKGEFVIIIEPYIEKKIISDDETFLNMIKGLSSEMKPKEMILKVSKELNMPKNKVYKKYLDYMEKLKDEKKN